MTPPSSTNTDDMPFLTIPSISPSESSASGLRPPSKPTADVQERAQGEVSPPPSSSSFDMLHSPVANSKTLFIYSLVALSQPRPRLGPLRRLLLHNLLRRSGNRQSARPNLPRARARLSRMTCKRLLLHPRRSRSPNGHVLPRAREPKHPEPSRPTFPQTRPLSRPLSP